MFLVVEILQIINIVQSEWLNFCTATYHPVTPDDGKVVAYSLRFNNQMDCGPALQTYVSNAGLNGALIWMS